LDQPWDHNHPHSQEHQQIQHSHLDDSWSMNSNLCSEQWMSSNEQAIYTANSSNFDWKKRPEQNLYNNAAQQQQSLEKAMQHNSITDQSNEQTIYTAMQHSSNSKQCNTAATISGERNWKQADIVTHMTTGQGNTHNNSNLDWEERPEQKTTFPWS
jgi:hypothetical protein